MTLQSNISCGHTIKTHFCFFYCVDTCYFLIRNCEYNECPNVAKSSYFHNSFEVTPQKKSIFIFLEICHVLVASKQKDLSYDSLNI